MDELINRSIVKETKNELINGSLVKGYIII